MKEQVIITTDLGYGDTGKGTMVDAIVHSEPIDLVVRYSGGAQAAHNVVTPDGRHHTFAQFGSGTFKPGVRTYLGPQMLVQPAHLLAEATALETLGVGQPLTRMYIDERVPVITPYHQIANQLKELARGTGRHGSTGIGIGETRAGAEDVRLPSLRARDLVNPAIAKEKLDAIRDIYRQLTLAILHEHDRNEAIIETWHRFQSTALFNDTLRTYQTFRDSITVTDSSFLASHLQAGGRAIMEAAQGTLLDEDYGFFPYVTRGKVRDVHAHELLAEIGYTDTPYVLGITRAYAARHGPGPFPTESATLRSVLHEPHNTDGTWQGAFRMGHFDAVATRYAVTANQQVDGLAVTWLDQVTTLPSFTYATHYRDQTGEYDTLPLPRPGDLPELVKRSAYLMKEISPVYRTTTADEQTVTATIAEAIGLPVVATSAGQTRNEKQFFRS